MYKRVHYLENARGSIYQLASSIANIQLQYNTGDCTIFATHE